MIQSARTRTVVLALLCLTAAAFNMTKAVHVDDTAYLPDRRTHHEVSAAAPIFVLNWEDGGPPAFGEMNQPALFFYLLAGLMRLFGDSVLVFHSAMAVASSAAIVLGYRIARRLAPEGALRGRCTLRAQSGLSTCTESDAEPSVPLLGPLAVRGRSTSRRWRSARSGRHYALAGVSLAAACLIKYSSLCLLVAMAAIVIFRRRWRALSALAIPMAALAG